MQPMQQPMRPMKFFFPLPQLGGMIAPVISVGLALILPIQAVEAVQFNSPKLPDRGAPGDNVGDSASRGTCAATGLDLTALVPAVQDEGTATDEAPADSLEALLEQTLHGENQHVWGQTAEALPNLWFYVPDFAANTNLEFILQSDQKDEIYRTVVPTPTTAGIIRVPISADHPLQAGQRYKWFLKAQVDCTTPDQVATVTTYEVDGWIHRTAEKPTWVNAPLQEKVRAAAEAGIWFDALNPLAKSRLQGTNLSTADREFVQTNWISLLESVDLDTVAPEAVIDCCQ